MANRTKQRVTTDRWGNFIMPSGQKISPVGLSVADVNQLRERAGLPSFTKQRAGYVSKPQTLEEKGTTTSEDIRATGVSPDIYKAYAPTVKAQRAAGMYKSGPLAPRAEAPIAPRAEAPTDYEVFFKQQKGLGRPADEISQAWAAKQQKAAPELYGEQQAAAEGYAPEAIPFKEGLSPAQKQSITDLIASGRPFSETDAKNYAYAIGEPNWSQFVGRTGEQAEEAEPEPPDPENLPGYDDLPDEAKSKADKLYDEVMDTLETYEAPEYAPEEHYNTLIEDAGLDNILDSLNGLNEEITNLEQGKRNREEDLRKEMRAENATESQIQRELAGQLRPLDRRLRELYDEYNILADQYNSAMGRIDTKMGFYESKYAADVQAKKTELSNLLSAYGLVEEREEAVEPKINVKVNDVGDVIGINEQTGETIWTVPGGGKTKSSPVSININQQQGAGISAAGDVFNDPANFTDDGFLKPSVYQKQRETYAAIPGANVKDFDNTYSGRLNPKDPEAQRIVPDITPDITEFDEVGEAISIQKHMDLHVGKDKKLSPEDYKYYRNLWIKFGGTYASFESRFQNKYADESHLVDYQ